MELKDAQQNTFPQRQSPNPISEKLERNPSTPRPQPNRTEPDPDRIQTDQDQGLFQTILLYLAGYDMALEVEPS